MSGFALAERLLWKNISKELLYWAKLNDLEVDFPLARKILSSQLVALSQDVCAAIKYQRSESIILDARLGRRYDPGMALQEATVRAQAAKLDAKDHVIKIRDEKVDAFGNILPAEYAVVKPSLTGAQLKALEFQKQFAARKLRRR